MTNIKVTPLAAESYGVRSMCTLVETPEIKVLLDAGVSLAPNRFGLPPHPIEFQTIAKLRSRIAEAADRANVVTISHYHFDHHTPSYEDWLVNWTQATETAKQIYENKQILLKNPKDKINPSQRQRAWIFQKTGGKYAKSLEPADGKTFTYGETVICFSEAVAHGSEDSMLGWVIIATIECQKEKFMFAPDVQGPISKHTTQLILEAKPDLLMIGGPPFYLGGFKVDEAELKKGADNLKTIVKEVPTIIIEHHVLRDAEWKQKTQPIYEAAIGTGHRMMTAAEFNGEKNNFLESKRRQLYQENPVTKEFEQWMRQNAVGQSRSKPPI